MLSFTLITKSENGFSKTYVGISSCLILLFFICFSMMACKSTRQMNYFSAFPRDTLFTTMSFPLAEADTIRAGDHLDIRVSSLNDILDRQFQKSGGNELNPSTLVQTQATSDEGFPVDANGTIHLHFLGKIQVAGMTKQALKSRLEKDLNPFMKDPIATIRFMNRKVTIIGEVKSPKMISLQEDRISLFDALVASGDLTENAQIEDVIIIRDSGQTKQIKHLNLNDKSLFHSSWFFLQHNDVVYVKKDWAKATYLERKRSLQMNISMIVSLITLATVVINNLIR
jgi:polysaccharide export outer membrane protein